MRIQLAFFLEINSMSRQPLNWLIRQMIIFQVIPNPLEDIQYPGIINDFVRKFDFFVLRNDGVPVSLFIATAGNWPIRGAT